MKALLEFGFSCTPKSLAEDCQKFGRLDPHDKEAALKTPCPVMGHVKCLGRLNCPVAKTGHRCSEVVEEDWKSIVVE